MYTGYTCLEPTHLQLVSHRVEGRAVDLPVLFRQASSRLFAWEASVLAWAAINEDSV
jgi:hypothetical protein